MKIKDLSEQFNIMSSRGPVNIEFNKGVENLETYYEYAEPGMRATITDIVKQHDGVMIVRLDYTNYDEFNKAFESYNYYDSNNNATLNARQAGKYSTRDSMYIIPENETEKYFTIISHQNNKLYNLYKSENNKLTYIAWLENHVMTTIK